MKRFVLTALLTFFAASAAFAQQDELLVMFWNLENFFDWKDGGEGASDSEFSAKGPRHWSSRRFFTKVSAVTKTILWTSDDMGQLPDIIGLAEVENEYVVRQLVRSDQLYRHKYSYLHADSPDPRGIDVALLYRKERLRLLSWRLERIREFHTRDILVADFETLQGDTVHVLVNHHPSKYGGAGTDGRRTLVMRHMCAVCDSLSTLGQGSNIVAMGDFNDTPDAESFSLLEGRLVNLAEPLARKGEGSIRFDGKWELIDMIMVSEEGSVMEVLYPPYLLTRDAAHSGIKPLRTYSGPRYMGGVSDHLPVAAKIHIKKIYIFEGICAKTINTYNTNEN